MNKKLVKVLSVVLAVICMFSFAVTGFAAEDSYKVSIRVEGLEKQLAKKTYNAGANSTIKEIILACGIDAVLTDDGLSIKSVKGEETKAASKWQYAVDGKIETAAISDYIVEKNIELVVFNATEDAVMPSFNAEDIATGGIIEFIGLDKNGTEAPIAGATIVWEVKDSTQNFKTDEKGKIYLPVDALEKGDHDIQISKVNADEIPTVVRFDNDMEIEVPEVETGSDGQTSFFDQIYNFFVSIFRGVVEVWGFYITEIAKLLNIKLPEISAA